MRCFIKIISNISFSLFTSYCLFTCLIHTPVKEYARLYILCAGIFSILVPAFMLSMWHYIRYQAQEINRLHNIIDKLLNIH